MKITGLQLQELAWDTDFFGKKMGRIALDPTLGPANLSENTWRRTLEVAYKQNYEFLLCEIDAGQGEIAQNLVALGAFLGDVLVTLSLDLGTVPQADRNVSAQVVSASPEDLPGISAIAAGSFEKSRFFQDPRFDAHKVRQLYPLWVQNAFQTTEVFYVIKEHDAVKAFISLQEQVPGVQLTIRLLAVEAASRGRKFGEKLLDTAIAYGIARGLKRITVGTQISNYPALRLYEKRGFRTERALYRFHFWLDSRSRLGLSGLS